MLPEEVLLIGQKLMESAKIENSNATFWVIFKHCVVCQPLSTRKIFVITTVLPRIGNVVRMGLEGFVLVAARREICCIAVKVD